MTLLKENFGAYQFKYPAFKFQEEKHATSMLEHGCIHLSKISTFRDGSKFSGEIFDENEGRVFLINKIPPSTSGTYLLSNKHAFPDKINISIDDAYVFCCTKYFLSDSLTWAMSEGKERCVLITDVDEYIKRVSNFYLNELFFVGVQECNYQGRNINVYTALPYEKAQSILSNRLQAAYFKPKIYYRQRELRMLWMPTKREDHGEGITNNIDMSDLLINIRFDDFDKNYKPSKENRVGVRITKKNSDACAQFTVFTPNDVFTPVIYSKENIEMMGFTIPSQMIEGAHVTGADTGITFLGNRVLICSVELKNIKEIEFYTY